MQINNSCDRNEYEDLDNVVISRTDRVEHHLNSRTSSQDNLIGRNNNDEIPRDKAGFIWCGFIILGITTLVPWNSFVTDTDYWMYKFHNVTNPSQTERTKLQTFFESYLTIASTLATVIATVAISLFGRRFQQKSLINVPLSIVFVMFIVTTILAILDTDKVQYVFLGLTIITVTAISFSSAVFQAGLFGYTANFPSHCMHSMVTGQAVAGILITISQIITLTLNMNPQWSGITFFSISTIFIGIALVYYQFMNNDYTRHYTRLGASDEIDRSYSILENGQELVETIKECWKLALSAIIIFTTTLSVFPSVCVLVLPQYPNTSFLTGRFFLPMVVFLSYNISDLLGRILSSLAPFPRKSQNLLLGLAIIRSIIPMLILFCNVVVPGRTIPVLLSHDGLFGFLVALTGFTQGYIFSSAMVLASVESTPTRRELTGFIMATCLGAGLALGSLTSTLIISILSH